MLKNQILERLREMQQLHLSAKLDSLSEAEQKQFLDLLSPELLKSQQQSLAPTLKNETVEPIYEAPLAADAWIPLGIERLTQNKVACLILAGGQGSRLGLSIPKALVPITPDGQKTLLELHLEKIELARSLHQAKIPCAIITSRENHAPIAAFIREKKFDSFTTLVIQDEAPFVDIHGNWILRPDGKLATGPDGNGYALHLLQRHGILAAWRNAGIEELTITPIDNPLADPVDPILIGYHVAHPADVTVKVITRQNAEEKVGIMVRNAHRIEVREYSELPSEQPTQTCLAHIGLFALNLSFAESVSGETFPWHIARKQDPLSKEWILKFERFIFDMLPFSQKTNLLLYPREDVYAPLKNASGDKSLATVQAALQRILKL